MKQDTRMTLLSRIPVMLLSFIGMTILTRWLGPQGNGIYTFIFANVNLLLLMFGLQSETAVLHYLSKNDADEKAVVSISLITIGASTLACVAVLISLGLFFPSFRNMLVPDDQPYAYFIWFILISFFLRKAQNTFLAIQRATLNFKSFNTYSLFSQIIPVVLYGVGFFFLQHSKTAEENIPVFNFILAGQAAITLLGAWMVSSIHRLDISFDVRKMLKPFYTYSFKSTIDAIAKFINRRIDIYFIEGIKGVNSLGLYGLASQVNNFAQEAILPFTQVMNPYLVKSDDAGKVEMITMMSRIISFISLVITLGILVCAPFALPFIFGRDFKYAVSATQILSLSVIMSNLRIILASYFQSINRLKFNIQSNWLGVILTIILDILLIPPFGIEGAAWASMIAYSSSCLFLFFHFVFMTNTQVKEMFFLRKHDLAWLMKKDKSAE